MAKKKDDPTALLKTVLMEALSNIIDSGNSIPPERGVANDAARVAVILIDEYVNTNSSISMALHALVESLQNTDDAIVKTIGILERTAMNGGLSMLRRQKELYARRQEESLIQATNNIASGEGTT